MQFSPISTSPGSYAEIVRRGGPQDFPIGDLEPCDVMSEIAIILAGRDSQPFQEFDQGATGGDPADTAGLNALRLDDDNEFPPMTHKING